MINTVKAHLDGKEPVVEAIYLKLIAVVGKFGPAKIEPHKTSIHLVRGTAFAGVVTRKSYLVLTIKADQPIESARIGKSEQTSRNRYHHEVKLSSPKEIDRELVRWLKHAWLLSE